MLSLPLNYSDRAQFMFGPELAGYWICDFDHKHKDRSRTMKSAAAVKERKARSKQEVIEAFYRAPGIDGITRPHTKARVLRQYLGSYKQEIDLPSLNTIKNYLREEKLI
jgi:hypothetical protein